MPPTAPMPRAQEGAISIHDILSLVRRRLAVILLVAAAVMAVASVVIATLPDVFEAKAVVVVKPAQVSESYKRTGYIVKSLSQLVGVLRQKTLSRETLRDLIRDLDLYGTSERFSAAEGEGLLAFDPVEQARKDIRIDILKRGPDDFVEISARARSAELAVKVVNRISDVMSSKNQAERLTQEQNAKAFLEGQLVFSQKRLQDAEAALARFREENQESLPENNNQVLDRISKLRFDKQIAQDRLQKAQLTILELQRRADALKSGAPVPGADSAERRALETELGRMLGEEAELRARGYGPGWPALVRVQASIRRLREELAGGAAAGDGGAAGAPGEAAAPDGLQMRAIMGQIAETSGVVAAIERDLEHNAAETARLEMLKSSFIQVRAKLEKVQAAHEEASAEHKALLQELRDVERLIALEEAGRTDQFQTIDPAELDAARFPVSPKRPMLLAAALAGAIAAGVGAAYLLELLRPAYRDPADLEADLHIDVLAALPEAPEGAGDALSGARRAPAEAAT